MNPGRFTLMVAIVFAWQVPANAQLTGYGVELDEPIAVSGQETAPVAALIGEVNRLKRARVFETTALQKEIDDLRIELRSGGQLKFRKVTYPSTDGLMIPAYLFEPLAPGRYPAIVEVHGGQHGSFTSRSLPRILEWVQSGYVILAPDYRSSSGYTETYYEKADYGGKEIDDMVAAVDYLESLPSVAPARTGIIGASHGGYNALMAVIRYPGRFQVAVDMYGPTDLVYRLTATPAENANTDSGDVAYFGKMVGRTIDEAPELYRQRSPRYLAEQITVPLLILHGDQDQIVNVKESLWLVEALRQAGNTQFEYEILEGANHGWPAALWQRGYAQAKAFLDTYLLGH
jgi:dipeptidyl aminopeptidase/acylaminoacyl peptidase